MSVVAIYTLVLIVATAISVTSTALIIRKFLVWHTMGADSNLHEFFTERLSHILTFYNRESIESVKSSFSSMLKRSNRVGKYSRRKKREVARRVMLKMVEGIAGENRDFASQLYEEFGFADEAIKELKDRRWWKRADATRELGLMKTKRAARYISPLLSDPSDEVRILAFESTIEIDGIGSLPVLAGMLRSMTTWNAINFSRIILEHRKEAAQYVLSLVRHTDVGVRLFAIRMLGILRSIEGVPALIGLAEKGRPVEVREALAALGRIGDERAVEVCCSSLESPDSVVKIAAAVALGNYGAPSIVGYLLPLLENDVNDVRLAAAQALAKCGREGSSALETAFLSGSAKASRAARHVLDDIELSSSTPIIAGDY